MEREIKELFEQFLIDEDCYSQFLSNLMEQFNCSLEEYLENGSNIPFEGDFLEGLIETAFFWYHTTEGLIYWHEKSLKWMKIFNNYSSGS